MWSKTKRLIVLPLLVVALLVGGTTGIALADDEASSSPKATFLETAAASLGITTEELQAAISEARSYVQNLAPEDRAEAFKAKVAEILGIEYGALQGAIDQTKAQIQEQFAARKAEMQGQFEARKAEMQERIEARKAKILELLAAHTELQEQFEARKAEMQEKQQQRQQQRPGHHGNGPNQ